jgi:hypothetical protein
MRMTWALVLSPVAPRCSHLHLGTPAGPVATYGGDMLDRLTVRLLARGLAERLGAREALGTKW